MTAKPISYTKVLSHNNNKLLWCVFFKNNEGSYKTYLQQSNFNFPRWFPVFEALNHRKEIWLENLVLRGKGLIDADSQFRIKDAI